MERLLVITNIVQYIYGRWLFQNLLLGMLLVIGLTITTSIMVSTLLVASLVTAYASLVKFNFAPYLAFLITGLLAIIVIALLIFLTLTCLRRLQNIPQTLLKRSLLASRPLEVWNAFVSGLTTQK